MIRLHNPLMNEAGDASGGGGAGSPAAAPAAGVAAPAAPAAGANDAPITRAELPALIADAVTKALGGIQPKPEAPKQEAPKADPNMPEWAASMAAQVQQLTQAQEQAQTQAAKQRLMSTVLAGVPEPQRGVATLAVEGLLATSGIKLDGATDVAAVAQTLTANLKANFSSLFITPGSSRPAVQVGPDGKPDFSGFRSITEVPPDLIAQLPDADYRRLRSGMSPDSGRGARPTNRWNRH